MTNHQINSSSSHFTEEILPTIPNPSTSRHHAFIAVYQHTLHQVLTKAPPAEEFDAYGIGFVTLVSKHENEGRFNVGLSYLVPRVYTLLDACGWDNVAPADGVACP
jgi:hypothetical protein